MLKRLSLLKTAWSTRNAISDRQRCWSRLGLIVISLHALSACTMQAVDAIEARDTATPVRGPVQGRTDMYQAMRCMDAMFSRYGLPQRYVGSSGLVDEHKQLGVNTTEMVITALSRISRESRSFLAIDSYASTDSLRARNNTAKKQVIYQPVDLVLSGGVTGLDERLVQDKDCLGIAPTQAKLGYCQKRTISNVTVDLRLVRPFDGVVDPEYAESITASMERKSRGLRVGNEFGTVGVSYNNDVSFAEGEHQTVRTAVEFGLITVLGRYAGVPYWECLDMPGVDGNIRKRRTRAIERMKPQQQRSVIATWLVSKGVYSGAVDGTDSPALRNAIAFYKDRLGQPANGDIDKDLLRSVPAIWVDEVRKRAHAVRLALRIELSPDQSGLVVPGTPVVYRLTPNIDGQLICVFQDVQGAVHKIFPNAQSSSMRVEAHQTILLPESAAEFQIIAQTDPWSGDGERLRCFLAYPDSWDSPGADFSVSGVTTLNDETLASVTDTLVDQVRIRPLVVDYRYRAATPPVSLGVDEHNSNASRDTFPRTGGASRWITSGKH